MIINDEIIFFFDDDKENPDITKQAREIGFFFSK